MLGNSAENGHVRRAARQRAAPIAFAVQFAVGARRAVIAALLQFCGFIEN